MSSYKAYVMYIYALMMPSDVPIQEIRHQDWTAMQVSNAIYFVVVTVCAPIWEEAIFRGFLLPSLTRYMPLTAAVAVSALSFAGAHFSLQRFLPLVLLGVIFGALLVRTAQPAALRAAAQPVERLHLLAAHLPGACRHVRTEGLLFV